MRRTATYVGQQVYEWLFSAQAQYGMTALAKVCAAMFGTSTIVNGLACAATSPASMSVQIGAGEMYSMASLEATPCGTLPADTTHTILKQGIQLDPFTTATLAAPSSTGQSINYLIEAQYQDSDLSLDPTTDTSPVILQFYNSDNPSTPWSGPNNSGDTSNTFRDGTIAIQVKAGTAANTGSQGTPAPDAGWTGLWVVTVPFGATSLSASNISQYTGAPFLSQPLLAMINARALLNGDATQKFSVAAATSAAQAVNLGQFETIASYLATQSGSLGNPVAAGTYTPSQQAITFPSASKSGAFRVLAQLVASGFSQAANVECQFQNALYDGTNVVGAGNFNNVYKKNSGYGWSEPDTFISTSTYAAGSTVTFTQRVVVVIEDTQFSLQNCFMRLWVIEA